MEITNQNGDVIQGIVLCHRVSEGTYNRVKGDLEDTEIRVIESETADQTLEYVKQEKPDMVITELSADSKPQVTELLGQIKDKTPQINRMVVSEEEHHDDLISFLMKNLVNSYFEGPEGLDALGNSIVEVLKVRTVLQNDKLMSLLQSVDELPVFPKIYQQFMRAVEQDKSLKEISKIIENDIAISTKVLQIANGDFYRSSRIGSIERAAIYLGLDIVKNIVFTVSLASSKTMTKWQMQQLEEVIHHSVQLNQNFQKLYTQKTGNPITDQLATIGITHDIGKIIILQYLPLRYQKTIEYMNNNPDIGFHRCELELGYEGYTHAEIGAYFLHLWNFPELNVFSALFHHSLEEFSEKYKEILDIFVLVNDIVED